MSAAGAERAFYLGEGDRAAFATFHPAADAPHTAVLLCPPFGWEEVCAYRCLREWARELAGAGHPTLRLSLPSTGDSGGEVRDPDRLAAWDAALVAAAGWLRAATGAPRVVAIGLGLGGMLAHRCAARGGAIDDLVLWAVPARGRSLVRQLRAFAKLETAQFFADLPQPPPLAEGELEAGGFGLTAQTAADLAAIDLGAEPLPGGAGRRALLLGRDGISIDERLRERLAGDGVAVTEGPGEGYAQMTSHPQQAQPATATFAIVAQWLQQDAGAPAVQIPAGALTGSPVSHDSLRFGRSDGAGWEERPIRIEYGASSLAGVLVVPERRADPDLCALLLNAGAVRRIGPSRMWVQAARRWAALGVPTLRLDVSGIGDAGGAVAPYASDGALYADTLVPEVIAALDHLQTAGIGRRFVLGGLCGGAYWAFHAALCDDRVSAALMLNPRALVWDEGLAPARYVRTLLVDRPSLAHIREVVTPAMLRQVARWLLAQTWAAMRRMAGRGPAVAGPDRVDALLDALHASGKQATFLFSEHEPLHDELAASGRLSRLESWPAVTLEHVAVRDHTMRPGWSQRLAQAAMDRALERELGAQRAGRIVRNPVSASEASATSGNSSSSPQRTQTAS